MLGLLLKTGEWLVYIVRFIKMEHKKTNKNGEVYTFVYMQEYKKHFVSIYFKGQYVPNSQKIFLKQTDALEFIASCEV